MILHKDNFGELSIINTGLPVGLFRGSISTFYKNQNFETVRKRIINRNFDVLSNNRYYL